jgi:hypothetical protein
MKGIETHNQRAFYFLQGKGGDGEKQREPLLPLTGLYGDKL